MATGKIESVLLAIEEHGWTWQLSQAGPMERMEHRQATGAEMERQWLLRVERHTPDEGAWRRFTGKNLTRLLAEALVFVQRVDEG